MTGITDNPQMKKWAETTTMHGISTITNSQSKVKKAIWCIILLSVMAATGYYVSTRYKDYISHDTSTSFKTTYQTQGIEFPVVTICNYNKFFYNKNSLGKRLTREIANLNELLPEIDWEYRVFRNCLRTLIAIFLHRKRGRISIKNTWF